MSWLKTFINSSIVKKQLMALTGLVWCGFAISHLIGNLLLIISEEGFNLYAHTLTSNAKLLYPAEAFLTIVLLSHVAMAIRLTFENKQARPVSYYKRSHTGRGATIASATMPYTGVIILVFIILHIFDFKFGSVYMKEYNGVEMRDLYRTVYEYFSSPLKTTWYVFAMAALCMHVGHGFQSAFQSLGFNHPKYSPTLNIASRLYGVLLFLGFSSIAIYCHVKGVS